MLLETVEIQAHRASIRVSRGTHECSLPAGWATMIMKNGWDSGRGKKGTGTKFRKGGENSSQSPFYALMSFEGAYAT